MCLRFQFMNYVLEMHVNARGSGKTIHRCHHQAGTIGGLPKTAGTAQAEVHLQIHDPPSTELGRRRSTYIFLPLDI